MNIFAEFQAHVAAAVNALQSEGKLPLALDLSKLAAEPPRDPSHGDIATNVAMVLAKPAGTNPRALAELLIAKLSDVKDIASLAIAGPGFINAIGIAGVCDCTHAFAARTAQEADPHCECPQRTSVSMM